MSQQPPYFDKIRENAARRWTQLEADPELAGPWHQLFAQVQSPRHVLSELLQNADDAGATTASVRFEGNAFVFSHNGEDFAEEHFASLCRFGYSNKRALHTIGFRGIGFKSTFSLGDKVELCSPTLSVGFRRARFTEPVWLGQVTSSDPRTHIRVELKDDQRRVELEKNLQEWLKSPFSLVFFRNIRRIEIGEKAIHWTHLRPGPVSGTEWMALNGNEEDAFLVVRSEPEAFPAEALNEIRNERLLTAEQDVEFPPCRVEIVLGAPGRLYVVLPTGVETELPFACNAPFIQDPARFKIKPPETSATNRWLLDRAGRLAGSVMMAWLEAQQLGVAERTAAYDLLPDVDTDDVSLEGACAALVEDAVRDAIEGKPVLLTESGMLVDARKAIGYPSLLLDVWPEDSVAKYFDVDQRPAFSRDVAGENLKKLANWGWLSHCSHDHVLQILQRNSLPRPNTWTALLSLWEYVESRTQTFALRSLQSKLRIVPVQGRSELLAAFETARIGERKLLQSEQDWAFLSAYLHTLDPAWVRFLGEVAPSVKGTKPASPADGAAAALSLLDRVGLGETSELSRIVEQAAVAFFRQTQVAVPDCIRMAQICAKLNIAAAKFFRYVTQDDRLHPAESEIVVDTDGKLSALLPERWCQSHVLHPDYTRKFLSCTADEWKRWVASGRSGLDGFARLKPKRSSLTQRSAVATEIERRGGKGKPDFKYVKNYFVVEDWDFDDELWRHWRTLAKDDDKVWGRIAEAVMRQPDTYWSKPLTARITQESTSGTSRSVYHDTLHADWILKFRQLACLPDSRGFYLKPEEVTRRTPETEPLIDVEPFVSIRFDQESTRPLLVALGVRDTPTGPEHLLDRVRALSKAKEPPLAELEKWYRRLDRMVGNGSTEAITTIRDAFQHERLLFTEEGEWVTAHGAFLNADDSDVPGVSTVPASLRDLSIWHRIGVAERPTVELAIRWLGELPSETVLSLEDQKRVRTLLSRYPNRVWDECKHWLNLANEWVPVDRLVYCLATRSLVPWEHLHEWIKQKSADFRRLPNELLDAEPFSVLSPLVERIEERLHRDAQPLGLPRPAEWMHALGRVLTRIELDSEEETSRVRALAETLGSTEWHVSPGLRILPYINGVPAGTPRYTDVVWISDILYVEDLPTAKLARLVPEALGKMFGHTEIAAALAYCFGRRVEDVIAYLEENFRLVEKQVHSDDEHGKARFGDERPGSSAVSDTDAGVAGAALPAGDEDDSENELSAVGYESVPVPVPVPGLGLGQGVAGSEEPSDGDDDAAPAETPARRASGNGHTRTHRADIVERFATQAGFHPVDSHRFRHADGSTLAKESGSVFNWERRTRSGEVLRYYWAKDHCLQDEALQIDAAVWSLIDAQPETHALILANPQGNAIEVSGAALKRMRDEGRLGLYPATYRMAMKNDEDVCV
ncbi:sacsin N-terminal ATP-binding-like domain-containing protein [Thauera sp. WB-2]|uniref:sacsin N-terminal ATP-binding-like domain-containing protein n=1 Tax=Thauera sp. WB-2 TaxID=2897772 RepID=UPI0022DE2C69|nr:hypothetical protein [Thauera sp. WB-2]WBL64255.1 ATP-binding protein [Thauera sp. WB-2]